MIRRPLLAALGAVGTAVLGNRLLRARAGSLANPLPGVERNYRWRGMDVAYTVAGDPANQDLLLLHGVHAGASTNEFAPIVDRLAAKYHVVAVDLPGFARSDRPPLGYSSSLYADFVADFASEVTDEPIVIASSLTGAFAVEAAAESTFAHLVLICPTAETMAERPWLRTLVRAPVIGSALTNALASKPAIRYFYDRDGYYDADNIDDEAVDYAWTAAHQPGSRYATAAFVSGSLDPDVDFQTELAALETPTTLVWGRDAELVPLRQGRELAQAANRELVVIDYATQLPHVEHPDEFVDYLTASVLGVTETAGDT